jgi:hypothetical protein
MTMKTLAVLLAGGVMAATLTGCSGDDGDKTPDADASKSPSQSESVDPDKVSPTDLPKIPVLKKEQGGAIKDLELGDCDTDKGEQVVSGTLTSSAGKPADFLVTVSWTTGSGDVMGRGFKLVKGLAPGESVDFDIEAQVADGATQCVPGVVYGKA